MGRAWACAITARSDLTLGAWVDLDPAAVEAGLGRLTGQEVGAIHVDTDLERAIAVTRPSFAVDATVPEAHFEVTLSCLESGVPVLGEKPMSATLGEARRLVEASDRTGVLFTVSQSRRYNSQLAALRSTVAEHLGGAELVACQFYRAPHFGGFRDEMQSPLLGDMAIHTFDAARWLIGADPVAVYCDEYNPTWSWYKGAACATAVFEFAGGARFSYSGSWCAEGFETSWEGQWRVVGPAGTAVWDGHSAPVGEVVDAPGATPRTVVSTPEESVAQGIDGSLAEFVTSLETGSMPMGECHDNIKSLAMCVAAIGSARTGTRALVET